MTRHLTRLLATTAVAATLLAAASAAQAYDADWKRGRLYFRAVCTACHVASPVGSINPSARLKAEWTAYLAADKHPYSKELTSLFVRMCGKCLPTLPILKIITNQPSKNYQIPLQPHKKTSL